MQFEGLVINNADDLRRHLITEEAINAHDVHPWQWAERFCRSHPEKAQWLDEALDTMLKEAMFQGQIRESDIISEIFGLASRCNRQALGPLLCSQIEADLSTWDDDEVFQLLDYAIGLGLTDLAMGTIEAVARHGLRKGCFDAALTLLEQVDRERAAGYIGEALGTAVKYDREDALAGAAAVYVLSHFEIFRPQIISDLKGKGAPFMKDFRGCIEEEADYFGDEYRESVLKEFDALVK